MCGLSGVMSSSLSYGEESLFRDLFNISSLRGVEGSGVIVSQAVHNRKTPLIRSLKTTKISGVLAYSDELQQLLKPRCNAIIGHARWPTKGGVDIKAVHPHRFGHIIGVHNGTLFKVAGQDVPQGASDSAMLFESFSKIGVAETMKETRGAYALVWIDEQDQTINFLRNSERTLFFKNVGWNNNISTLYWSSEQEMLDFAFKRGYKGNNTWTTYLPIHKHFKYPLDVRHVIRPESVTEVKPDEPKPVSNWVGERWRGRGTGGHNGGHHNRGHASALPRREIWNETWPDAEDLPWQNVSDMRDNRPVRASDGKVWDMRTCRWVDVKDNVLRLPSPQNIEDKLKELAEGSPPVEPEKPVEASTETIVEKPLSKQAQKRRAKLLAQEERDAIKRLQRFQQAARAGKVINPPKEVDEAVSIETDDLNDEIPDLGLPAPYTSSTYQAGGRSQIGSDYIRCVGRGCAWCGSVATAGDNVYPTSNDVGSKYFVCIDCGSHDNVKPYLGQTRTAIVVN